MKKLIVLFGIVCFLISNPLIAKSTVNIPLETSHVVVDSELQGFIILQELHVKFDFEIERLNVCEESDGKECRMTVKGTIDGKEVDLEVVIKGQTCAEFFRELMKE